MCIVVRGNRSRGAIVDGGQRVSAGITRYSYPNATIVVSIGTGWSSSYYPLSWIGADS